MPLIEPTAPSRLARFRNAARYQRGMQVFKWSVLPDFVFLPLIVLVAAWLAAAGVTQTALPWLESGTALCPSAGGSLPELVTHQATFRADGDLSRRRRHRHQGPALPRRAARPGAVVRRQPRDDARSACAARDMGFVGIVGAPFRRVIEANYLQPIVEIRKPPHAWRFDSLFITALPLTQQEPTLYAAVFTADHDGELFVFANDAVSLHDPAFFYQSRPGRNHGTAALSIARLDEAPVATAPQPEPQRAQAGGHDPARIR